MVDGAAETFGKGAQRRGDDDRHGHASSRGTGSLNDECKFRALAQGGRGAVAVRLRAPADVNSSLRSTR